MTGTQINTFSSLSPSLSFSLSPSLSLSHSISIRSTFKLRGKQVLLSSSLLFQKNREREREKEERKKGREREKRKRERREERGETDPIPNTRFPSTPSFVLLPIFSPSSHLPKRERERGSENIPLQFHFFLSLCHLFESFECINISSHISFSCFSLPLSFYPSLS